jgi:hypothetical protein
MVHTACEILGRYDGRDMWHTRDRSKIHISFWLENLKELDPLGRPRRKWEYNIKIKETGRSGHGRG